MSKIEFTLDGKTVTANPGQTILEVAAENGIKIPSLCYNSKVSKNTSCFVCVVKDGKTGKFLPSCSACPAPHFPRKAPYIFFSYHSPFRNVANSQCLFRKLAVIQLGVKSAAGQQIFQIRPGQAVKGPDDKVYVLEHAQ